MIAPNIDPRFPPLIKPLTKKELSDWLNCSERFLELEVNAGRLRKVTMGVNRVRFLPRDVNDWLEAGGSTAKVKKPRKSKTPTAVSPLGVTK
jgi:excisionase family DNA binding protein